MVIVDTALEEREKQQNPIQVGLVGAGYMGRGITLQLLKPLVGMRLAAIANRTISKAERAYREAGSVSVKTVESITQMETAIQCGQHAVTDDFSIICQAQGIDAIIEATGEVEFGAHVALQAIENGKHLILLNAELDATIGPILKLYADRAGVIITNADGDEPGVAMNLIRFLNTIGFKPVIAGNIKGMIDPYRTPHTQREFANKYNQEPKLITSFADGTKLSMETTVLANAAGFKVGQRGMYGFSCNHVKDILDVFPLETTIEQGLVDYVLGAAPNTGAFVVGYNDSPLQQQYLDYFKMGSGPFYVFYTPYHLPHIQIATSVARAVLFHDATVTPKNKPMCEVITIAKRDLKQGEVLDGIGGFTCYGVIDNADVCRIENLLPMGVSQDCVSKKKIAKDQTIKYDDVELPKERLCDKLRKEQCSFFN